MKLTIHQNISIRNLQITRMSNAAVLRIGASESVSRLSKIQEEPTILFLHITGISGPHVPLHAISH